MNDFKSFKGGGKPQDGQSKNAPHTGGDVESTVNMAAMMAKAFSGKSEGQIWQTILQQAEQGKRDGTLTNADLDNFYAALAPLLDGFKKQKLKSVIAKLKAI